MLGQPEKNLRGSNNRCTTRSGLDHSLVPNLNYFLFDRKEIDAVGWGELAGNFIVPHCGGMGVVRVTSRGLLVPRSVHTDEIS